MPCLGGLVGRLARPWGATACVCPATGGIDNWLVDGRSSDRASQRCMGTGRLTLWEDIC